MRFPNGETVYVLRARRVLDPYSGEEELLDWSDPERTAYDDCAVAPRVTDEPAKPGEAPVLTEGTVYSPHLDMDVTARDRLEIRGVVWDIDGEPFVWRNPISGWAPGVQINFRKREG